MMGCFVLTKSFNDNSRAPALRITISSLELEYENCQSIFPQEEERRLSLVMARKEEEKRREMNKIAMLKVCCCITCRV